MANFIVSSYSELKESKEKTLPEYYLAKAKFYAAQGRNYWMVDGLTDEKRYFSAFEDETRRIASAFHKLGLRKDDVVIYMVRDLCKLHVMLTGVWRANAIMRASYPDDDSATILARVQESKVRFIVCEEDSIDKCKDVAKNAGWSLNIITVNRSNMEKHSLQSFLEDDDGSECPEFLLNENDPAVILCTSGTTGFPKGAVHTHKTFLHQIRSLERIGFTFPKPNLIATKATHISGTTFGFVLLGSGKTGVCVSNLTRDDIFNATAKYKPGLLFAFPTFLVAMAGPEADGYDFSCVDLILSGGVPITPAIRKTLFQLPNVKDIIVAYGLTEFMMCTTSAIMTDESEREVPSVRELPDFSVGKPYPGVKLQIRDPETFEVLGPNRKGEICVKSEGIFHSYLNNPEATRKTFVDGYFKTGDIGYYDVDGFVYVVDRSKDIFKYYNDHISPTELEDVIGKHPKVSEVCVIGVADAGGHVPRAFVTVHSNSGTKQAVAEEIKQYAHSNLAVYKQLRGGLYIVGELPKGKTGKVTRLLVEKLPIPQY